MRKQWQAFVVVCILAFGVSPVLAQDNEEDGDYKALMQKTTNNANGIWRVRKTLWY